MLRKVEKDNKNNLWDIYSGLLGWAVGYVGTTGVLSLLPSWPRHMHTKLEKCFAIYLCMNKFRLSTLGIPCVFFLLMLNFIWCCQLFGSNLSAEIVINNLLIQQFVIFLESLRAIQFIYLCIFSVRDWAINFT